jgi:glutaconate CoA-transferase, subunit B
MGSTTGETKWTRGEMLAVAASSLVRDGDVAVVGLGLPQVAAVLAKRTHAPDATLLLEIGVFEPAPTESAMGIADPRLWEGSTAFGSMMDVLGAMLHGGRVTLGLLGALQVDGWGSVNSTVVTDGDGNARRFNGSGGANDIASCAGRVLVVMQHHPRKFVEVLQFLTSPGRCVRGVPRADFGLKGEGTTAVVTDRAIIGMSDRGPMLISVHPGEDPAALLAETPLPLIEPPDGVVETSPPTSQQLHLVRAELDPHQWYTG